MRVEIVLTADSECKKCKGSGVSETSITTSGEVSFIGLVDTTHKLKVLCECVVSTPTGMIDK